VGKYNKQDIIRIVEEEDVEFIRLQFVDIYGTLKNMAVTTSQLEKVLDNKYMFDGSVVEGFSHRLKSELFLAPDLDSFTIFPWRPQQGKVARFICGINNADGSPFEGDSRHILKRVMEEAESMGYTFDVGPECEFFLFDLDEKGEPTTHSSEKGGYFDISPSDSGENARREMVLFLEDMDFEVESSYHAKEVAQHKIDFKYDNALTTADNIVTFKLVVRTVAKRHGLHASFMPKPNHGVNGAGMHLVMSLSKDGKNIFTDLEEDNKISKEAYYFMAGIFEHIEGMTLINNPIVNSYKRLVPGYGAPVSVTCSAMDTSALIRMTCVGGDGTRLELRSPDSASNPYLAIAVCLAAGLDGIKRKLELPVELDKVNVNTKKLPTTLEDAIYSFKEDGIIQNILGKHISEHYIMAKQLEWSQYCEQVTNWEVDNYLYRI
jgi:glutamine synthetase